MQKLPKEIEAKRKMVDNLQKVIDQPALGQDDIAALKEKMKTVRTEIEELTNKKNVSNDPIEDKLTLFRQRVRKKTLKFSVKCRRHTITITSYPPSISQHFFKTFLMQVFLLLSNFLS